jgi:hypothetical protein
MSCPSLNFTNLCTYGLFLISILHDLFLVHLISSVLFIWHLSCELLYLLFCLPLPYLRTLLQSTDCSVSLFYLFFHPPVLLIFFFCISVYDLSYLSLTRLFVYLIIFFPWFLFPVCEISLYCLFPILCICMVFPLSSSFPYLVCLPIFFFHFHLHFFVRFISVSSFLSMVFSRSFSFG